MDEKLLNFMKLVTVYFILCRTLDSTAENARKETRNAPYDKSVVEALSRKVSLKVDASLMNLRNTERK